jgi:hypothetical protein
MDLYVAGKKGVENRWFGMSERMRRMGTKGKATAITGWGHLFALLRLRSEAGAL